MVRLLSVAHVRQLALSLPDASEEPHHDRASFRVRGRIFATLPDDEHLNVMLSPDSVEEVLADSPPGCSTLWWGKRISGVRVVLASALPDLTAELLAEAHEQKSARH